MKLALTFSLVMLAAATAAHAQTLFERPVTPAETDVRKPDQPTGENGTQATGEGGGAEGATKPAAPAVAPARRRSPCSA